MFQYLVNFTKKLYNPLKQKFRRNRRKVTAILLSMGGICITVGLGITGVAIEHEWNFVAILPYFIATIFGLVCFIVALKRMKEEDNERKGKEDKLITLLKEIRDNTNNLVNH